MYRSIHTKRPLDFCWLSFSRIRVENSAIREMDMKKAGLFSKSGCNWWVTPGSNPSSKEKRANPIYENETQFLREKSPQTLGITGKKHCRTLLFGNDVFTLQKRSGIHWGARRSGFSKKSKNFHFSTYKRRLSNHWNFGHNNSARLRCAVFLAFFDVLFGASPNEFRSKKEGFFRIFLQIQTGTFEPPRNWTPFFTSSDETCQG